LMCKETIINEVSPFYLGGTLYINNWQLRITNAVCDIGVSKPTQSHT
jgi:hypothetical protein